MNPDLLRYLIPMAIYFGPIGIGLVVGAMVAEVPGAIVGGLIGLAIAWFLANQRS